ncbi:MAG: hypothetical protein ACP5NW_02530 [Candidatus Woesearchaeota archaeon]
MTSIDDSVKFDWAELFPLAGLYKCYSNFKIKGTNYMGIGGMMRKNLHDSYREIRMNNDWGRPNKVDEPFFPLPIDAYVYLAYQAFVSTPIVIGILEKL